MFHPRAVIYDNEKPSYVSADVLYVLTFDSEELYEKALGELDRMKEMFRIKSISNNKKSRTVSLERSEFEYHSGGCFPIESVLGGLEDCLKKEFKPTGVEVFIGNKFSDIVK
jgi:hypothetical protein